MGIMLPFYEEIGRHIDQSSGGRVLSLGYPDLTIPLQDGDGIPDEDVDTNSPAIAKHHGFPEGTRFLDPMKLLKRFGYDMDIWDIEQWRGVEKIVDLNRLHLQEPYYDLVIDPGTLEHTLNPAIAMENVCRATKAGGVICHWNPFFSPNHGFWNINPTFYHDWYGANGFDILRMTIIDLRSGKSMDLDGNMQWQRFGGITNDPTYLMTTAKRIKEQPLVYPTQSKYARMKHG